MSSIFLSGQGIPGLTHLASPVAGLLVDVELKVLVLVHEAPPRLQDGKVAGVLLRDEVVVVAVRQLRLDLDGLEADLKPQRNWSKVFMLLES